MTTEERIREAVTRLGAAEVARRLGVTTESVARILAGIDVRRGTMALVSKALEDANALA